MGTKAFSLAVAACLVFGSACGDNERAHKDARVTAGPSAGKSSTTFSFCPSVPAADTWPNRAELAQERETVLPATDAGEMRTDMTNWLDMLDEHLDEIRASGARKIGGHLSASGMVVQVQAGTGPKNLAGFLRSLHHDPKRLVVETVDICPKSLSK